jgi:hypothetical protein
MRGPILNPNYANNSSYICQCNKIGKLKYINMINKGWRQEQNLGVCGVYVYSCIVDEGLQE